MHAAPGHIAAPGWAELTSQGGRELLDSIAAATATGAGLDQVARSLRAQDVDPALLAAALTQSELRARAHSKFGALANEMLFTRAGLEQATRAPVAALHAARFRDAGCSAVADLGCGLGAESLALLRAGLTVLPVELDPLTAAFATHNLAVQANALGVSPPSVRIGDAQELGRAEADAAFLDPARRTAGHNDTRRIASPDDYSPSLHFAFGLADEVPTGVKLGPGLDRDLIPATAEAQWVSVDGQLVETALWFGRLARPGITRSALLVKGDGSPTAELAAPGDAADAPVGGISEYLYEPDGAVIRARLIGDLAEQLGATMLSPGIAYLSAAAHVDTPFAQAFRILDQLPAKERDLRRALTERGIGSLEIKKRGADVDPAALRKRLKLRGSASATLFLTRDEAGKHIALLAERC